jgi:hypothetical protein
MSRACSTRRENRIAYRIFVGNAEGFGPPGRPNHTCVDNIKMVFRYIT